VLIFFYLECRRIVTLEYSRALNSAALIADAGHSLSDLISDFVVLFTWRISRRPPTYRYPYGFGKFESVGSLIVSILLIGGALGIGGVHMAILSSEVTKCMFGSTGSYSYGLLLPALSGSSSPALTQAAEVLANVTSQAPDLPTAHAHEHHHDGVLDPNAAWFALASILIKEWLYRASTLPSPALPFSRIDTC
jgi:divalent metal cation (Fe/Co/Zn/Cd) transporter